MTKQEGLHVLGNNTGKLQKIHKLSV